jgi:hypothetical protein
MSPVQEAPARRVAPKPARRGEGWRLGGLAGAVVGLVVALNAWGPTPRPFVEERPEAGSAGLAEAVPATRVDEESPISVQEGLGVEMPKNLLPGQRRPPCSKREREILGGCWLLQVNIEPPCGPRVYEWKKGCYVPMFDTQRPPTSDPP